MMKILAIETSTKNFSLAVADGNKILRSRNVVLKNVLSSSIIPSIKKILDASSLSLKQIDGFTIGLGPGSFTSLRVGLATVKAFGFATGKPVVGIPSLDVLAMNLVPERPGVICSLCDAKRNLVYACCYLSFGGKLRRKTPYLLTPIEDLLKNIDGEASFLGDAVDLYRDRIEDRATKNHNFKPFFADAKKRFPLAKNLIPLAWERFEKKKADPVDKLVPLYLYPHDCQIRK